MVKIAVIGATGWIGSRLIKADPSMIGISHKKNVSSPIIQYDILNDPKWLVASLKKKNVNTAIILSGVTDIKTCQKYAKKTYILNVKSIVRLIRVLLDHQIRPVFFSSDHVFDGKSERNYVEEDDLNPLTTYGLQKAMIEEKIKSFHAPHLILRLSKTYGTIWNDNSFLTLSAKTLVKKKHIFAVHNIWFNPIHIDDVIRSVILLIQLNKRGVFHVCSSQKIDRYSLMVKLCGFLGLNKELVKKVSSNAFYPFSYPENLNMSNAKLKKIIGEESYHTDGALQEIAKGNSA